MLDKLPLFLWKILLPRIYAVHREQVSYVPNSNEHNYNGLRMSSTITAITALRQTCKYMRDAVLTPEMCKYALTGYQLSSNSSFIAAIPRPPKFIEMHWDKHMDHRKVMEGFTPLYWIRAMTFDVKRHTINAIMLAIGENNKQMANGGKEFGWTVHLTDAVHEIHKLSIDQDVELIGLSHTQLRIMKHVDSKHRWPPCSMYLRNLNVLGIGLPETRHYIGHNYDHLIIDNCTFKGSHRYDMLGVMCKKLAVTNCKFNECRRAINNFNMFESINDMFYDKVREKEDQGTSVMICNNRFDNCVIAMNLRIEYCVVDQVRWAKQYASLVT
ncbi:Hypothetical protein MVR_LOCUS20 [uncultured virus]|nr:Hypothetical protein MVR_LOCUS20 [uncultured virus]